MCGIAGICNLNEAKGVDLNRLRRQVDVVHHRGPDEVGLYIDDWIGLGHARLSIIDLSSGTQPIHNEDETLWIVYNGEVFNYVELRQDLQERGHQFYTNSDTEVILHLYEEKGADSLSALNGQFAFAIWDTRKKELFVARDRMGIRPLHYAIHNGSFFFGSEIKSIFVGGDMPREIDPIAMDQIFTFWTTLASRTVFKGIYELPPGHCLTVSNGKVVVKQYWQIPLCSPQDSLGDSVDELSEKIQELLLDAVRIRLRADVPVGCYLSGGLDSSALATLVTKNFNNRVRTFGIRFEQAEFDEGDYQNEMVSFLQCNHSEINATNDDIGNTLEQVLWHCEKPLLRTSPIPLFLLSRLVNDSGFKVVLTGEGADEIFGGYNIFRESKLRRFWARDPKSDWRGGLMGQLYPYIFNTPRRKRALQTFFARGLDRVDDPLFSHLVRWENTCRLKTFFSDSLREKTIGYDAYDELRTSLPDGFDGVDSLCRAQYLEMSVFLSNYLLSSQGDRMAMGNSLEIRLPYLDYRIIELMAQVPARWKLLGLDEKHILKRVFKGQLPARITDRAKHPYRAPIRQGLLDGSAGQRSRYMLARKSIDRAGLFNHKRVDRLLSKCERQTNLSEIDSMALVGILSAQWINQHFVDHFNLRSESPMIEPKLVIDRRLNRLAATKH